MRYEPVPLGVCLTLFFAAFSVGCAKPQPQGPPSAGSGAPVTPTPGNSAPHPPDGPSGAPTPEASTQGGGAAKPGSAPARVETRSFASASLGVSKSYLVYLPKGYDDSNARFPVVFLLHGLAGNETNWTKHGGLVEAANAVDPGVIVVMPDGDDGFYVNGVGSASYESCLSQKPPWDPSEAPASYCVKTPRYEDYITLDLLREVDTSFRTLPARASRAIAGLSMGGFGATELAFRHSDLFTAAASLSGMVSLRYAGPRPFVSGKAVVAPPTSFGSQYPAKFRDHVRGVFGPSADNWAAHDPTALVDKLPPDGLAIYLECGDKDDFGFQDHAAHLHTLLEARGVAHEYHVVPGKHTWAVWKPGVARALPYLSAHLQH